MYNRLKHKRFVQIFEYLDEARAGVVDVVGMLRAHAACIDELDPEVRAAAERAV